MRSNKAYTNTTFTKRVDYDGGAHRGPKSPHEPLVCRHCGNVYLKRRWLLATDPRAAVTGAAAEPVTCPACEAEASGVASGFLRLEGAFFVSHRPDIDALLRAEAARAAEDNPLGRIIKWEVSADGGLVVATSTEHLASRLGEAVRKAYGGDLDHGFSHGNKLVRATWRRD